MFGVDDALLAAGVSALGNAVGGWISGSSAKSATDDSNRTNRQIAASNNAANLALNRENNAFTERMSSSAYQRAVADAQKAGLNPYMALIKGGESTPSASSIPSTVGAPQLPSNPDYGKGVSSAAAAASSYLTLKSQEASIKKMESDIAVNAASAQRIAADTGLTRTNTKIAGERYTQEHARTPVVARDAGIDVSTFGNILAYVNRIIAPTGSALAAVNTASKILGL